MLAVGFSNSTIKVWSIVPLKLRAMKSAELLADIDKEAEDVLVRMMDDKSAETSKMLFGHHGPVYSMSFSPDRNLLLSSSEDTTSKRRNILISIMATNKLFYLFQSDYGVCKSGPA